MPCRRIGGFLIGTLIVLMAQSSQSLSPAKPPIVYTIAGSDSGGGAGIQADLHAIHSMKCHGCSAITCLTAQNSVGVTAVHAPDASFLQKQLDALMSDLPPAAVKIGMLGTKELADMVGKALQDIRAKNENVWVVVDPVMISTSGSKLLDDDAVDAMIQNVFPQADVITPNKFEAEALLHRELKTPQDIETGAKELLEMGCKAVLIKGGHTLTETSSDTNLGTVSKEVESTLQYAQDYLLSSDLQPKDGDERLCDSFDGVWLRSTRYVTLR